MVAYIHPETSVLEINSIKIHSFLKEKDSNLDSKTVESFGEEWTRFNDFTPAEIRKIGNDYFDLATMLNPDMVALDVGCGSGRWANYLHSKVKFIEAIDPSHAVYIAANKLQGFENIRITQASVENIPFGDNSFDFVYSLGVLHHVPDTVSAIKHCFNKTKQGGWFLLYLYYNLENRGFVFRLLFNLANVLRQIIARSPQGLKHILCDMIAAVVYWPMAKFSQALSVLSEDLAKRIPLSYYRKTSFFIMRNDSLDRFGTPLEKRFSKKEIKEMLVSAGFHNIQFSPREPFWHVIAQKP